MVRHFRLFLSMGRDRFCVPARASRLRIARHWAEAAWFALPFPWRDFSWVPSDVWEG